MKIKIEEQEYSCGNGCCYSWWYDLFIDGQCVNQEFDSEEEALGYVLKKYFNVEIEDDQYPAYAEPFSEYGHYGENNGPVGETSND